MYIKNYNSNIGYKNIDVTIRNFHIYSEFHNHAYTTKHLDHNWTKIIWNNKIEYHSLIKTPNKEKRKKKN